MSKPVLRVTIGTLRGSKTVVTAVIDTGSFYTIVRKDALPPGARVDPFPPLRSMRTAHRRGKIKIAGAIMLTIAIGRKIVWDQALVSPDLGREMLLGAGTMQTWDISIKNSNGRTSVNVGHDMRDPEITEVD